MTRLVLASASPRRRELLTGLGLAFEVRPTDVDERLLPGQPPEDEVARLARAKASAVAAPGALVVAADTMVVLDGTIFNKPHDSAEAATMLRRLRGREHQVLTGVAVRADGRLLSDVVASTVLMRSYSDGEIAEYIASGSPLDKAGAYAVQDEAFHPAAEVVGCYCNVVGLPVSRLLRLMAALGEQPQVQPLPQCRGCPESW